MTGAKERDRETQLTPGGYMVENWQIEHYLRLKANGVAFMDVETSRTWDLCELGKMMDIRKKD